MIVKFCLALLALSSLTAASDPDCEELLKPLEDRSQVAGKWIYHAGTSDNEEALNELKMINSSWMELSLIPDSENMTLRYGDKSKDGKCHLGSILSTFTGNYTKATFNFNSTTYESVGKHLETCPDCILWTDNSVRVGSNGETRKSRNLYLFSKTGEVEAAHMEVVRKQAACLNFSSDFHFGGNTDLCPDEAVAAAVEEQ